MKPKRILIVEDDARVAFLLKEHLSSLGPDYTVEMASSGSQALEQVERHRCDLVITDNRMPGITGLELIETLKEKAPATVTMLMTAYGSEELEQAAQRLNVYHYMTKPFPMADLTRVVQDALALKQDADPPPPPPAAKANRQAMKVVLAGDGAVGKSSLVYRLCTDQFVGKRTMTIGVEFHLYDIKHSASTTRLIVWDVGGQDHFSFTRRAFYRGSKAVGLVYDTSERRSFERLEHWKTEIRENLPSTPLVLAGNKTDLPRQVSREEGQALAEDWNVPFFETSCVSGRGVREFFSAVANAAALQLQR